MPPRTIAIKETELNPFGGNGNSVIGTPWSVFKPLNDRFNFTLDVCAVAENTKVKNYLTGPCIKTYRPCHCGLCTEWGSNVCWMNPPYTRGQIELWIDKAIKQAEKGATVVALTHLACSSQWARQALKSSHLQELMLVYPRIQFDNAGVQNARDSMLLVFSSTYQVDSEINTWIPTKFWTWQK